MPSALARLRGLLLRDAAPARAAAVRGGESRTTWWTLHSIGLLLVLPAWLLPWFIEQVPRGVTKKPGYGFSPQDALTNLVSFSPTGIGSVLVLLLFLCMLGLLAGFVYDAACLWLRDRTPAENAGRRLAYLGGAVALTIVPALLFGGNIVTVGAAVVAVVLVVSFARDGLTSLVAGHSLTPYHFMRVRAGLAVAGLALSLLIWALVGVWREENLFGALSSSAVTDNAVWMMVTGMAVTAFAFLLGDRVVLLLIGAAGAILAVSGAFVPWMHSDAPFSSRYVYGGLLDGLGVSGLGQVLLDVVLVAVVVTAAGFVADCVASLRARRAVLVLPRVRGGVALAGAAAAVGAIWVVVTSRDSTFGHGVSYIDSRAGVALAGLAATALLCLLGDRITTSRQVAMAVVALAIGGLFPLIFNQSVDFIVWGAGSAAIYTLLALGLNVVVGFAGLLDLGYAAFFAIGAYTAGSLNGSRHGVHLSFFLCMWVALAMAALFGAILGAPTLRLRGDYLAIVTLGFGEIVPDMAKNNLFDQTGGPNGITGILSPSIFGYGFGLDKRPFFWTLLIVIVLVMIAFRNLERSRVGRAWVAIREDEIAASATGINTVSTKLLAFAIGASVSGFAGAFLGAQLGLVTNEDFDFAVSVTALSTVVLGGIGSIAGAAIGGVVISFVIFWVLPNLQEWITTFGDTFGISAISSTATNPIDYSNYKYIVYGVILISVMLLRPGGLLPSRARRIELQAGEDVTPLAAVREVA